MKMDQQIRTTTSRLFNVTIVDVKKDDVEEVIVYKYAFNRDSNCTYQMTYLCSLPLTAALVPLASECDVILEGFSNSCF